MFNLYSLEQKKSRRSALLQESLSILYTGVIGADLLAATEFHYNAAWQN